ncbi:MAG TPA: winged helix-turn-helix domain-containing protein [Baekduia sp.]
MLDPVFLAALGHPARLQALVSLEKRPASSREIAGEVELSPSATAYHVRKLYEAGLIVPVETRQRRAFEERVWRTRSGGWVKLNKLLLETAARNARA